MNKKDLRKKISKMLFSYETKYGEECVDNIMDFISDYVSVKLRLGITINKKELLIDFCKKVDETLEEYGHLAPNEKFIDEYLKSKKNKIK